MTESNRVEYKRELTDSLEKEIVAFLNYPEGGIIYLGIDRQGKTVGIDDIDDTQLKIKDRLKNNILPSCLGLFDVICETHRNKAVIKIIVASGSEKPYYLKKYGMSEKGCFIRLGSASEPMTVKMIEALFSGRTRNSISRMRSPRQALSFEQLKIYYQEANLTPGEKFAANLELLTEQGEYNYAAYLLADENNNSIQLAKCTVFPVDRQALDFPPKEHLKTSEKTSEKILRLLKRQPDLTIAELANQTRVSDRSVERNIKQLQNTGKLRRIGPDKGGYWQVTEK